MSGHLLTDDWTTRRPRKGDPEEGRIRNRQQRSVGSQDDEECQGGDPVGRSYTGRVNVTISGRTCQDGVQEGGGCEQADQYHYGA